MMINKIKILSLVACTILSLSCTTQQFDYPGDFPDGPDMPGAPGSDDGDAPDFDTQIYPYEGQTADDADKDIVGTDSDIYWEANSFKNTVKIIYTGETATVESSSEQIISHIDGAHVTIDMLTNSVSGVRISISGQSNNGSLKIYGDKKLLLNLDGVTLSSNIGPAINSQCKKRIFVNLAPGSVNTLTDATAYSDDPFYLDGHNPDSEDRKGCLFTEGNIIFSGAGSLIVAGKHNHAIASDGYMYMRPGVTVAVTQAAKNAIHIKGDKSDDIGIVIAGGLIYTLTEAEAGKGLKTDYHIEINGGQLQLNTKGNAIYDADAADTSSASAMKADGNISISGGNIYCKSIGTGGKGINADGSITFSGGVTTVVTTGTKYVYNAWQGLDSSPKGIKAQGDITVDGGTVNVMVTGQSDSSEGIESKSAITVNDGEIYVYAFDDAINAATGITFNGGKTYAYAVNNDGIDSNGYLYINGGLIVASGASGPEESLDCEISSQFIINGGIVFGTGGNYMTTPSSASKQHVVLYGGLNASKGQLVTVLDSDGKPVMTLSMPRSMNSLALFLTSPSLQTGKTYTLSKGGTLTGASSVWNGLSQGGNWTGGTSIGSFTTTNAVTTAGSGGMGGPGGRGGAPGPPGQPGPPPPFGPPHGPGRPIWPN